MADMFKKIKKQNGERFAKAIRAYDNGIFDIENLDQIVKYAGREAEPIMDYLISLKGVEIAEHTVSKTPLQLLDEAGYDAYYADTLEKQNAISHYYADIETLRDLANRRLINDHASGGEKLCTFGDPHRFEKYYIINAVRKDVDEIRREDFPNPEREDKYGTSVLSIQILKTGGFISIKNRYNHTVQNPDNTLNSNPDNIIEGLSMAIKQHFNVDFSAQKAYLPRGYTYINDKLIKYQREENNIYVGDSFYVKDGEVTELNKDYQEMIDHRFILDKKNGTITDIIGSDNSFVQVLQNEIAGKKISVSKDKESDTTKILVDGQELCMMQSGKITCLNLLETTELPDYFLSNFEFNGLEELNAPKLKRIGNNSFNMTRHFKMNLPELEEIGNHSFFYLRHCDLDMPKLKKVGQGTLPSWYASEDYAFDCLEEVGNSSLSHIKASSFPKLKKVGHKFCHMSLKYAETLYVPELEEVGRDCFCNINEMTELNFPKLRIAGGNFLRAVGDNRSRKSIHLPNLERVGQNFMCNDPGWNQDGGDYSLDEFNAPKLKTVGINFMGRCTDIQRKNMPSEINVLLAIYGEKVETFMPKMPEDKRPKYQVLKPKLSALEGTKKEEQPKAKKTTISNASIETSTTVSLDVSTPVTDNVSSAVEQTNRLISPASQSIGLKNRLYELSEKGRLARMIDAVKGIFSKRHKNQR